MSLQFNEQIPESRPLAPRLGPEHGYGRQRDRVGDWRGVSHHYVHSPSRSSTRREPFTTGGRPDTQCPEIPIIRQTSPGPRVPNKTRTRTPKDSPMSLLRECVSFTSCRSTRREGTDGSFWDQDSHVLQNVRSTTLDPSWRPG